MADGGDGRPTIGEVWSKDRLMGKNVSFKGLSAADAAEAFATDVNKPPISPKGRKKSIVKLNPLVWGQPGHLTEEEADTYVSHGNHKNCRGNREPSIRQERACKLPPLEEIRALMTQWQAGLSFYSPAYTWIVVVTSLSAYPPLSIDANGQRILSSRSPFVPSSFLNVSYNYRCDSKRKWSHEEENLRALFTRLERRKVKYGL